MLWEGGGVDGIPIAEIRLFTYSSIQLYRTFLCVCGEGEGGGGKQNEIKMKRIWDFGGRGPALHKKSLLYFKNLSSNSYEYQISCYQGI